MKSFPGITTFLRNQEDLLERLRSHFDTRGESLNEVNIQDYPDKGYVRRELYPWNEFEPDRFSADVLKVLNNEVDRIAPKLEVKVTELPFLG